MSDPPSPGGERSRSDAASRLAALLADVADAAPDLSEPAPPRSTRRGRRPSEDEDRPEEEPGAGPPRPADEAESDERGEDVPTAVYAIAPVDRHLADWAPRRDADGPASPSADSGPPEPPEGSGIEDLATARPAGDRPGGGGAEAASEAIAPPATPPTEGAGEGTGRDGPDVELEVEPEVDLFDEPDPEEGDGGGEHEDEGGAGPDVASTALPVEPAPSMEAAVGSGRRRRLTVRSAAFGLVLGLLVVAIPVLGLVGAHRLSESRGGTLLQGNRQPDEPGYFIFVDPTHTMLVVHRDAEGGLASATLLAYGADGAGGTVLQIPLTTQVREPKDLIDRVGQAYEQGEMELFHREVEDRLGVAIQERVDLTDGQIAELVRPVAPLTIDNPDDVVVQDGETYPSGTITLAAEEVGPFLRAGGEEPELAHLARNEVVWRAWLQALGAAGPGSASSAASLGPFLQSLASGLVGDEGTTRIETLDVGPPEMAGADLPLVPGEGFDAQVNAAVPYPQSPGPGRRYSLMVLNGVDGTALPREILHNLVMGGASLAKLGNGNEFGQETTTIEVVGDEWRPAADVAVYVLGGKGKVTTMSQTRADDVEVDVVITVGRDVLDYYQGLDGG